MSDEKWPVADLERQRLWAVDAKLKAAIAEIERLRSRCEAAEAQNELLEEDVLRFLRQRNAALERAAAEIHPGPDGADDIIRREMVREWVDEGHDRVDEEDRQRLTAIQRMIAAEVRAGIADELAAALEAVRAINTAYRTGSQPSGKALDAANKAADALARWAASGVSEQAETPQ